ncbi:MAG: excinuclease ABC subunit UvrC [Peptococcaceae bacterium]|nr:excinuclease ABC subunit UvrC [Peptococcaceae bacterium]
MNEQIEEKLGKLPARPGVYLMRDAAGKVIYVGKALSLRSRVRSYFKENLGQGSHSDKTRALVRRVADLEWILTDSEMEALILECNLIKKYKPRYNIRLMDDKGYPYVRITVGEDFPRVEYVHKMGRDGSRYFGPYTSSGAIKDTLKLLRRIFPLRSCVSTVGWGKQQRPCLNRHIGRCLAPCAGQVSKEDYGEMIRQVILFLEGKQEALCRRVEEKMAAAAEEMRFEEAAQLRDQLAAIRQVVERQKVLSSKGEDYDAINYARGKNQVCVQLFYVREGKLLGRESFFLEGVQGEAEVLLPFLQQYYSEVPLIPPGIYLPWQPEETVAVGAGAEADAEDGAEASAEAGVEAGTDAAAVVAAAVVAAAGDTAAEADATPEDVAWEDGPDRRAADLLMTQAWLSRLRGGKVQLKTPKRGEKKALVDLVGKNARDLLLQQEQRETALGDRFAQGLAELREALNLDAPPRRMECYDISHISGTETVASMVVSIDGRPRPELYRRFRIKTVEGNNDFASMAEVILRRFSKERQQDTRFGELPDLVIIDGGKGQLSSARSIMELLGVGEIAAVGLAKQFEWLYKPAQSDPIVLDQKSPAIHLVQLLRDEAHRFAITYHRLLRGKRNLTSALDEIPGLGPKGKKALLKQFDLSLKNIMAASREALAAAPGLSKKTAAAVYDWFHPEE